MKKLVFTLATFLTLSLSAQAVNVEPKLWNNTGADKAQFKKGDTVKIKTGSQGAKYILTGKVDYVCNAKYIKVNGYFIAIADVEVIVKYYHVK